MPPVPTIFRHCMVGIMALAAGAMAPALAAAPAAPPAASTETTLPGTRIVAVVNGDVISAADVENRARLFAMSTGISMSTGVLDRLKPQITRQLVDERLRIQESLRRKIVIADQQIAAAVREVEQQNRMQPGTLRQRLAAGGVNARTLIDQIRAQLGWTQILRDQLADQINISEADIDQQRRLLEQQVGKPEYRIGEIFVPVDDPANTADAQRFAETVIGELRAGAPFPIVAAQFSQTQTALEGGDLGWVQANQLDPAVARLATEMPIGAVSNPVKVPGGFSIINLLGRREIGRDVGTAITLRRAMLPFTEPLNPAAPTEQQRQTLEKAKGLIASVHGCDQMEEVAKRINPNQVSDPGELRVESVSPPQFRQLLATLPIGKVSEPLISSDGIIVLTVCSREQKNMAGLSTQDLQRQLVNERIELLSRQLMRDLRRQGTIEMRGVRGAAGHSVPPA